MDSLLSVINRMKNATSVEDINERVSPLMLSEEERDLYIFPVCICIRIYLFIS